MRGRAAAAAVIALCAVVPGCGDGQKAKRADVSSYITQVNAVQQRLAQPLLEVSKANRDFASPKRKADPAALRHRLDEAGRKIRVQRERLAAIEAPPEARRLRALMLELVDREAELTDEVAKLVTFIPAFSKALQPLGPAGPQLKTALAGKAPVATKAAALDSYRTTVETVLRRLSPLRPPPASVPVYRAQVSTLEQVRTAVTGLASALRLQQRAQIAHFLRQFDLAAVANQGTAAQKAQIAAVRAYNGRVKGLTRVTVALARERASIEKRLR
jgi:hypothetical protein